MLVTLIVFIFMTAFLTASVAVGIGAVLMERRRFGLAGTGPSSLPSLETPLLLQEQPLSTISVWRRLLVRFDFVNLMRVRIADAGLRWSVGRVTLTILLLASLSTSILFALDWAPVITAPLAVAAWALAPYLYVLRQRKARFQQIEEQFPDALDSLSRALRAGQPFAAGMYLMADECPEPLAQEVRRTCSEWKLGLAWPESLNNFALRIPLLEIRLFVAAVGLHSRFGGKLNEILEELAKTIRDSIALRGEVRAISAQARMAGTVLTILPLAIAAVMIVTNPSYLGVLLRHPYGKCLTGGALVCLVLGHVTIQRIVSIKT